MYRYDARVTPDAEGFKDALAAWAEGGYAASGAPPPLDVPPEASALDWLRRGALQKLAEVRQALETQASGSHWGGGEKGGRLRPALLHRHPLLLPHLLTPPPHPSALPSAFLPFRRTTQPLRGHCCLCCCCACWAWGSCSPLPSPPRRRGTDRSNQMIICSCSWHQFSRGGRQLLYIS